MFVCVTDNRTGTTMVLRRMGPNEVMDARKFADQIARAYDTEIDNSDGHIPGGSGDISVEFRNTSRETGSCWSSQDFFFAE
jgi:hypothetical protein